MCQPQFDFTGLYGLPADEALRRLSLAGIANAQILRTAAPAHREATAEDIRREAEGEDRVVGHVPPQEENGAHTLIISRFLTGMLRAPKEDA